MTGIVNAAPMANLLGIQDLSTRELPVELEALPTHLPKIYIYAKKGPTSPQLVVGNSRTLMYGADSFDLRQKWSNHATVLSNLVNAQGNSCVYERIQPADAATANFRWSMDVLQLEIDDFERNDDGSFKLDDQGAQIPIGNKIAVGFKIKHVIEHIEPGQDGESMFGLGTQSNGNQTDAATQTQSQRYPIADFEVSSFGDDGDLQGFRMWAPTTQSLTAVNQQVLSDCRAYPFRFAFVRKSDANSTPSAVATMSAEQYVECVFRPNTLNKNTDQQIFVGDKLIQSYQDLETVNQPPLWGPFSNFHLYTEQLESLLEKFYEAELAIASPFTDFDGLEDELYKFNFVTGQYSNGVPYHSVIVDTKAVDSFRFSEATTAYAQGGKDGEMSDELFAEAVSERVKEYADPLSHLQSDAKNPESIIYDSGFPLKTKYDLISFIAIRKDTAVVLSVYTVGGPQLSASEESSLALALKTRLQMYPESEYFGTPVVRGMVVGRNGFLINSQYSGRLPLTLEIAAKAAAYMGASDGKWKSTARFSRAPGSFLTMFRDVNVSFTPAPVKNKDWSNGLVWVENFSRRQLYFPALKTVYDNDTSVLNSFFTMLACCELEKVATRAQRQFSGADDLTVAQIIKEVNDYIAESVLNRFDGRFVIIPETYYTDADRARGYSFSCKIKIYAPNMITVGTLSIEARRLEDLEQ